MYKVPSEDIPAASEDWGHFSTLVRKILDTRSHADLGSLIRGDLQHYIRHDLLIAAWGNFRMGVIHYDLLACDPAVHAEGAEAGAMTPGLMMLFQQWVALGRQPVRVDVGLVSQAWDRSGFSGPVLDALKPMKTVILHGIQDQRGRNDSLYAFFSPQSGEELDDGYALRVLVPYLDVAIRQIELPPTRDAAKDAGQDMEAESADSSTLSEREAEILKWVALGKTNLEIGSILNLSSFTVKNHMQRIFKKLDVFNRAQAVSVFRARNGAQH